MAKQEYVGENHQASLTFFQERSNSYTFIHNVAEMFVEGRNLQEMHPLSLTNSILSEQEHNLGAFEFYRPEDHRKYFFRPTNPEEIQKSQSLQSQGIAGLIPYEGSLSLPHEKLYGFGSLDGAAINLATIKLKEQEEQDYFDTFDVLTCAAQLMASFHRRGLIFNNFVVENIVVTPDLQNPLLLYDTSDVEPVSPGATRERDIQSFLSSLQEHNPSSIRIAHKQFFNDKYKESL